MRRIALLAAATLACGAPSHSTSPSSTGQLTVTVTAPTGVKANVTVMGPGGYRAAVPTTVTLTDLPAGQYTVSAVPVTTADTIVGSTIDSAVIAGSPATVGGGQTANASVVYHASASTGALWIANLFPEVGLTELGVSTLRTSTASPTPIRRITQSSDLDGPKAIAFDPSGNLWFSMTRTPVEDTVLPAIFEAETNLTLADSTMTLVGGLAFDSAGDLWVASDDNCAIVEYTASQLAAASGPTSAAPALKFTTQCQSPVIAPQAITFDVAGNLWVGDLASHTIYEYNRFGLTGSGTVTRMPSSVITLPGNTMPSAIAFDANDDLWVTENDSIVFVFGPGSLGVSGSPSPLRTLVISGADLVNLAFDNSGNLWLADFHGSTIDELSAAQLRGNGVVTPVLVITGSSAVAGPDGLAFSPAISGLPLFTRRR